MPLEHRPPARQAIRRDDSVEKLQKTLRERRLAAILPEHALVECDALERSEGPTRYPLPRRRLPHPGEPARKTLAAAAGGIRLCRARNGGDQRHCHCEPPALSPHGPIPQLFAVLPGRVAPVSA